ncbi:MAG: hypothetical protein ACLFVJ_07855 [Persicimonas sp.]
MKKVLARINQFVGQQLWLDMDILSYEGSRLVVIGSVSRSYPHELEITFDGVFFVSLPVAWTTGPEVRTIALAEGEEARALNEKFRVERGHCIFKFEATRDYPDKRASCEIKR